MKIETSASCLSGHFRSAAYRTRHPEWNFLEDFSRHISRERDSTAPSSLLHNHVCTYVYIYIYTRARSVCGICRCAKQRASNVPVFAKGVGGVWIHVKPYIRKKVRRWLPAWLLACSRGGMVDGARSEGIGNGKYGVYRGVGVLGFREYAADYDCVHFPMSAVLRVRRFWTALFYLLKIDVDVNKNFTA